MKNDEVENTLPEFNTAELGLTPPRQPNRLFHTLLMATFWDLLWNDFSFFDIYIYIYNYIILIPSPLPLILNPAPPVINSWYSTHAFQSWNRGLLLRTFVKNSELWEKWEMSGPGQKIMRAFYSVFSLDAIPFCFPWHRAKWQMLWTIKVFRGILQRALSSGKWFFQWSLPIHCFSITFRNSLNSLLI